MRAHLENTVEDWGFSFKNVLAGNSIKNREREFRAYDCKVSELENSFDHWHHVRLLSPA